LLEELLMYLNFPLLELMVLQLRTQMDRTIIAGWGDLKGSYKRKKTSSHNSEGTTKWSQNSRLNLMHSRETMKIF
jgi:hypothetical protein